MNKTCEMSIVLFLMSTIFTGCGRGLQITSVALQTGKAGATITTDTPTPTAKSKAARGAAIREEIERKAKVVETESLAKKDALFATAVEEHKKDSDAYRFSVRRWGHWLELSMARLNSSGKVEKYSTSVNLDLVTTLHLNEGRIPDMAGELAYYFGLESLKELETQSGWSGSSCGGYFDDSDLEQAPKGYSYKVTASMPYPPSRYMFEDVTKQGRNVMWAYSCGGADYVKLRTSGFPRFAEDDEILLDGIARIYTPAGMGNKVYREILTAKDSDQN